MRVLKGAGQLAIVIAVGLVALFVVVDRSMPTEEPAASVPGVGSTVKKGETPAPDSSLEPRSPAPGECFYYDRSIDGVPATIDAQSRVASTVVVAEVLAVEGPSWTTTNGQAPAHADRNPGSVYRIVTVRVDGIGKGKAAKQLTFRLPGGKVGCDEFRVEGVPVELSAGDAYAFFLQPTGQPATSPSAEVAVQAWPLAGDGAIATPAEGKVSVSTFVAKVKATIPK